MNKAKSCCNLLDRQYEPVLAACQAAGIAFLPRRPVDPRAGGAQAEIAAVAAELDATPAQVARAWLLHHSPVILPIPGTSRISHPSRPAYGSVLEAAVPATAGRLPVLGLPVRNAAVAVPPAAPDRHGRGTPARSGTWSGSPSGTSPPVAVPSGQGGRGEFASRALGQDRDPGLLAPAQHQYLPKEGVGPQALGAVVTGR
ncbi:hypothetical protein [Streptomyces sp. WMMC1477]|uniref:hypothetical protein n=1 Tax=Streptomyces sp. WMMC1477 TaxID=3015155 RepID=UPI003FCD4838